MKISSIGFMIPFLITSLAGVIGLIIGYNTSVDVRGWWPLGFMVGLFMNLIYAGICSFLYSRYPISLVSSLMIHGIIGLLFVILSAYFYYHQIDWVAVSEGTRTLTLMETFMRSPLTSFSTYFIGMIAIYITGKKSSS